MSRISSTIFTIKCDVVGCENQLVNVQIGHAIETDSEWGQITINGESNMDLCPDHLQGIENYIYGPDEETIAPFIKGNMEVAMGMKETND